MQKPVVLCVLDGWGYRPETEGNAIELGETPVWHGLLQKWPHAMITTYGKAVGLPDGQMGNSEVGHTNLGAGRVVMQDLPRIDAAIEDGSLAANPVLKNLISALEKTKGTCHLMGLLSDGGVHSHQAHMVALARILDKAGIPVCVHAFTDGRDTPPDSAQDYVQAFINQVSDCPLVKVATIAGRFYAMDRDNRWERVTQAYETLIDATGPRFATAAEALNDSYAAGTFDEFVVPCVIGDYVGMKDGDAILMANFRSDRAREITRMLLQPDFDACSRPRVVNFCDAVAMTEYSADHKKWMHILFPVEELNNIFGEIVSKAGLKQLRIAETEKYAHVTFFFNGGKETLFDGEERILVPSPKVATYDLKPEMSALEVTDKLVEAIEQNKFDVIIVNYANGDMVGHTGILPAAIKAVEVVDACVGRLVQAVTAKDGILFITADHGNAEQMIDPKTNAPYTAHTAGDVQAVLVNAHGVSTLKDGKLADVAPTLLKLMGLEQPKEMNGTALVD